MNLEEIEQVLAVALPLRVPTFGPDERPREKVAALESYMLSSAEVNGGLVEARHWLREVENRLSDQWEGLEGWEAALRRRRAQATAAEIKEAKIRVAPALYAAARRARTLRESVTEQIARFEREEKVVSRAYTMVSGG